MNFLSVYQWKKNIKKYGIFKKNKKLKAFQNIVAIFKIISIDFRFFVFMCRASRICSCSLLKENNTDVGLTMTTLPRRLMMHLNDSSSIAVHLKTHSIPKSKFQKILVENNTIIAHKINKLQSCRNKQCPVRNIW